MQRRLGEEPVQEPSTADLHELDLEVCKSELPVETKTDEQFLGFLLHVLALFSFQDFPFYSDYEI